MLVARWRFGPALVKLPPLVMAGGVLGCLGAAGFAWSLLQPADPVVHAEAVRIITEIRIPQHSLPEHWFDGNGQAKLLLVITAIVLARRDPVGWVLLTMTLGIAALSIWVYVAHDMQLALAAPWRASAIVMPAANAILLGRAMQEFAIMAENRPWFRPTCLISPPSSWSPRSASASAEKVRQFVLLERTRPISPGCATTPRWRRVFDAVTRWISPRHRPSAICQLEVASLCRPWPCWNGIGGSSRRAGHQIARSSCDTLAALAAEGVSMWCARPRAGAPDCPGWRVVYEDGADLITANGPQQP